MKIQCKFCLLEAHLSLHLTQYFCQKVVFVWNIDHKQPVTAVCLSLWPDNLYDAVI